MKVFKNLFALALGLLILSSCNDDEGNANSSKVKVALKASQTALKAGGETSADPLLLETFQICLGEIEFDVNDDMEDMIPGGDSIYSDIELEGPFLIDLLSADAITGIDLATAHVPNAVYEEIEFEFEPYNQAEPAGMTGNTMWVQGSYEGTAFTIVSDEEIDLELEYANGYVLDGADSRLFIDLNLGQLKTFVAAIDFASAVAEEDGSILISRDKNKAILDQFEKAVEDAFDIDEDDDEEED